MALQETYSVGPPRADLIKEDFDTLVYQKGRDVILEYAFQCPCKSKSTNQQSNCKNCGGTAYIFVNPTPTRMVITGVAIMNDFKAWSDEGRGFVNITANSSTELSFMDRITVLDGKAIFNEVLFLNTYESSLFAFTAYNVKKVLYIGLFQGVNQPLLKLDNTQVTITKNIVQIDPSLIPSGITDISVTIKYIHAPVYHVMDMKRETMQTYKYQNGAEIIQNMPISAVGRRAHYMLDAPNLQGDRLLDNSYIESDHNCEIQCNC